MIENAFFTEYWANPEDVRGLSNWPEARWRANEPYARHEQWQKERIEGNINNLMLLRIDDAPERFEKAELYAEVWGGHEGNANRRLLFNGKGLYALPDGRSAEDACIYQYLNLPLEIPHLVKGMNSVVMMIDRGTSWLGNFMIDQCCVQGYLPRNHEKLASTGLSDFSAKITVDTEGFYLKDNSTVGLAMPRDYDDLIERVEYYACYEDYSISGREELVDWQYYTQKTMPFGNIGCSEHPPYTVSWDTTMIPTQERAIQIIALIRFRCHVCYNTPIFSRAFLSDTRDKVRVLYCNELPRSFWSRDSKPCVAGIRLPIPLSTVQRAWLYTRIWDGGTGGNERYFTVNGHPLPIATDHGPHVPVIRAQPFSPSWLKEGRNELILCSTTEHHGIEMLRPFPAIKIELRREETT